jgi:hypothetical protein
MSKITAGSLGDLGKATAGSFMSEEDGDRQRQKRTKPSMRRWRLRKKRR